MKPVNVLAAVTAQNLRKLRLLGTALHVGTGRVEASEDTSGLQAKQLSLQLGKAHEMALCRNATTQYAVRSVEGESTTMTRDSQKLVGVVDRPRRRSQRRRCPSRWWQGPSCRTPVALSTD